MYPIINPTIGNIIITSNVNLKLNVNNAIKKIMIVMGSLNNISKVLMIDHSISIKSLEILERRSPFFLFLIDFMGIESNFLLMTTRISFITPFLIGTIKYNAKYLKRLRNKKLIKITEQIKISALALPLDSIV